MTKVKSFVGLAACGLILGVSQVSQAAAVDFEDLSIPLGTQISPNPISVTSGGYQFNYGPDSIFNGWDHLHAGSESFWANNGTTVLTPHYDVIFARTDSSLFSLGSMDLAGFPPGDEGTMQVIGTFADSSTISTTFTLDGIVDGSGGSVDFETFAFGWNNLASVRIVNTAGSVDGLFSVDNITPVPEPETYAMLLAGLGLLGFMAHRRKETAV